MMDIERQERELSRYWNELLTLGAEPDASGVDDTDVEMLRQLAHMTRAPLPVAAVQRVDQGVQSYLDLAATTALPLVQGKPATWRNGHEPDVLLAPVPIQAAPSRRGGFSRLAQWVALVVLLATLGGLFAWVAPLGEQAMPSVVLPALPGGTDEEMLLTLPLPSEALPRSSLSFASLSDFSLPARSETSWESADGECCSGFRLVYVLEGALSIEADGGGHVLRSGVSLDPAVVAPGGSVTVGAGDGMLMRFEDTFTSGNPSDRDARFLEVVVIGGYSPLVAAPLGWKWHPDGDYAYGLTLPDRAITLRLFQTKLDPGVTLLPPPGAITQLGVTVADDLPLRISDTDDIENLSDKPVTVHVLTLMPVDEGIGVSLSGDG